MAAPTRRTVLRSLAVASSMIAAPKLFSQTREQPTSTPTPAEPRPETWLLFTKSAGFEHSTIKRVGDGPTFLHRHLAPLFEARGLALLESKDGGLFEPEKINAYAGFVFHTTGDLTTPGKDGEPPMSAKGKQTLLDAVAAGVPFIGLHCATDTFGAGPAQKADGPLDPFLAMLGGEFDGHGEQQIASIRVADDRFPGAGNASDFSIHEEWYALRHLAEDLHPIHVLDPKGLRGAMYNRPPYPVTWTRRHGDGNVFYTAIGHREDTVASKAYAGLVGGAIDWCRDRSQAKVK